MTLEGVADMMKLLGTAVPVHQSNTDPGLVFRALNDTVRDAHARPDTGSFDLDEDDDPVPEPVQLCSESGLESVDFGP